MPVGIKSSGGGTTTLVAANSATNYTATLPANSGTVVTTGSTAVVTQTMLGAGVSGNGPTFSAYQSSPQTLTSGVMTKIQFQTEEWDTANCFDSTTNYRFTPNVAGYYSITGKIQPNNTYSAGIIAVYKNGALYKYGNYNNNTSATAISSMTCLVYLNGTTDYVELWASLYSGQPLVATADMTYFQGFLARAA